LIQPGNQGLEPFLPQALSMARALLSCIHHRRRSSRVSAESRCL